MRLQGFVKVRAFASSASEFNSTAPSKKIPSGKKPLIKDGNFAFGEYTNSLRLASELADLRSGM